MTLTDVISTPDQEDRSENEGKKAEPDKASEEKKQELQTVQNPEEKPDMRVEVCFPYLRYKLPVNDRQTVLYTPERSLLYTQALLTEVKGITSDFLEEETQIGSIVFRGGAGLEEPKTLGRILRALKKSVPAAPDCEISLEANLGEIDLTRLEDYRRAGIHRFFIRAYSFSPATCRKIGCLYDKRLIDQLTEASLRVNRMDLAIGLYYMVTSEESQDFRHTLEEMEYMKLSELRFVRYPVKEEKAEELAKRKISEAFIRSCLTVLGYKEYQTMAFARPGRESRDYVLSSRKAEKVGFGMGAETQLGGYGSHNLRNFEGYLRYAGDYEKLAQVHVPDDVMRLDDLTTAEDVQKLLEELKESLKQ